MNSKLLLSLHELLELRTRLAADPFDAARDLADFSKEERQRLFPAAEGEPKRFIARTRLVLPIHDGDNGTRPINNSSNFTPGLVVRDRAGQALRSLKPDTPVELTTIVRNLGNADAPAATVEFFASLRTARRTVERAAVPGDRFLVDEVFSISGRGTVAVGEVISGTFALTDRVTLADGLTTIVAGLQRPGDDQSPARTGERIGLLLRGIRREQLKRGQILEGRSEQPAVLGRPVFSSPEPTVKALEFLGVRYLDAFCERDSEVKFEWTTPSPPTAELGVETEIVSVTLYARVHCVAPEDLPDDLDRLDPDTMRHVARSRLKADFDG